ncbi:MAG: hypothetical protein H7A37_07040 [Chlamydiales bacterium]|nr:hypothetical protein [Chlamydiales bacterium]
MNALSVLNDSAVSLLERSVSENLPFYQHDFSWIDDFFEGEQWKLKTRLVPIVKQSSSLERVLVPPENEELFDLENSKRLYEAFKNLTPVQARDQRLWIKLGHVEFWQYMRKRWPAENNDASWIRQRYLFAGNDKRALIRNGISRLWWYSYMTFDEERENPYELTEVLLSKLDIAQTILERSMGSSKTILHTFLDFLRVNDARTNNRIVVRSLAKYLYGLGGYTLLDSLSPNAIKSHLMDELERIS